MPMGGVSVSKTNPGPLLSNRGPLTYQTSDLQSCRERTEGAGGGEVGEDKGQGAEEENGGRVGLKRKKKVILGQNNYSISLRMHLFTK